LTKSSKICSPRCTPRWSSRCENLPLTPSVAQFAALIAARLLVPLLRNFSIPATKVSPQRLAIATMRL
jgi:hypothetical protein